jgi:hypothetical protein
MKERDALFDFDESLDNLSEISDKYAVQQAPENGLQETPKKLERSAMRETLKQQAIKELSVDRRKSAGRANQRDASAKSGLMNGKKSGLRKSTKIKIKTCTSRQKLNSNLL